MNESGPVFVSEDVLQGLEYVRGSGETNMFDFHAVQRIAFDAGFDATAVWLEENRGLYARGIFRGFAVRKPRLRKGEDT